MIKIISRLAKHLSRADFPLILVLSFATVLIRIALILNAPYIYAQDAFLYLKAARDLVSGGPVSLSRGMPFVAYLGIFLGILGPILGDFLASRIAMLTISVPLVAAIYLLGRRMSNKLFSFLAATLALLEPISLEYSIVPYADVFASAMSLTALYLAFSGKKIQIFLAPFFFYVAILTRSELYFALLIAIVFFNVCQILKSARAGVFTGSFKTVTLLLLIVYVIPAPFLYQFVQSWGVLGLRERFALFFKPELLARTIQSSFSFYDAEYVNQAIILVTGLILLFALLNVLVHPDSSLKSDSKSASLRERIQSLLLVDNSIIAFSLLLFFVTYAITVTIWGYGYTWAFYVANADLTNIDVLRRAIIIAPTLNDRYLIPIRLLTSYPLAYPVFAVARKVRVDRQ